MHITYKVLKGHVQDGHGILCRGHILVSCNILTRNLSGLPQISPSNGCEALPRVYEKESLLKKREVGKLTQHHPALEMIDNRTDGTNSVRFAHTSWKNCRPHSSVKVKTRDGGKDLRSELLH